MQFLSLAFAFLCFASVVMVLACAVDRFLIWRKRRATQKEVDKAYKPLKHPTIHGMFKDRLDDRH